TEKSGTSIGSLTVCVSAGLELCPWMVMSYAAPGTALLALMVSVDGVPGVIAAGTKPQEIPAGGLTQESATLDANVPTAATFTVVVLLEFWLTVIGGKTEMVKSCPLMTCTCCVWVRPPPVAEMVKFCGPSGLLVVVSVSAEVAP